MSEINSVIITGATGAIGTALINELILKDIEILVLTRKDSKRNNVIPIHKNIKIKYCSLEQYKELRNDTGKKYDVFFHFAWMGTNGDKRNDMYMQIDNIKFALDAVELAKRFGCHTFIGAGSQAEYGRVNSKLKSDTQTFPETGYGYAKLCAGQMTRDYAKKLNLRHMWVRVLSVYGPNDGDNTMIMSTISKLKKGIVPQFTKGEQIWDYLYSKDAAKAFFLLAKRGIDGKVYVLGSGKARPLSEYIHDIQNIIAPNIEIKLGSIPYSEKQVMYLCADIEEIKKDCGFEPSVSFIEGIENITK